MPGFVAWIRLCFLQKLHRTRLLRRNPHQEGAREHREALWRQRLEEFRQEPMFGIGFCRGGTGAESVNEKGFWVNLDLPGLRRFP